VGLRPISSRIVSNVNVDPDTLLNQRRVSSAIPGSAVMKLVSCSTNRVPNRPRKTTREMPASSMTRPVARPRCILFASRETTGSMASAANHAMIT
jgi:hypothetical protein